MPTQYYRKNNGSPEARSKAKERENLRIRRRYKKNLNLSRKLLPGEKVHVEDMAVVLRLAGYSQDQIARVIGLSQTQVMELLKNPVVNEKLVTMRKALPAAALDLLQDYMIEAVQTVVDVMRSSDDDKIVLQAAGEILDRSGLAKASRQERHQITENRTVFTDDGILEQLRKASPELQEQAAQVIEQLENLLNGSEKKEIPVSE
jgi:transcriptional regulator with XRE-family HTH domain